MPATNAPAKSVPPEIGSSQMGSPPRCGSFDQIHS